MNYNHDNKQFKNSLCAELGKNSLAAIFMNFHMLIRILMYKVILIKWILETTLFTFLTNVLHNQKLIIITNTQFYE